MGSLTLKAVARVYISLVAVTSLANDVLWTAIAAKEFLRLDKLFTIVAFRRMIDYSVRWHLSGFPCRKRRQFQRNYLLQKSRERVRVRNVLSTITLFTEGERKVSVFGTVDTKAFEALILPERWYEPIYIFFYAHFFWRWPLMSIFALAVLRLERNGARLTDGAGISDCIF